MSIVVPTFNAETFVAAAVRSALAQTCDGVEVIVVDDCSSDRTLQIVQDLASSDPRLQVHSQPRNMGPAAARNRGFELARGKWISVLDADDRMAPSRISDLIEVAERVNADIVSDNLIIFSDADSSSTRPYIADGKPGWISAQGYLHEGRIFYPGRNYGYLKPVFRADSLRTVGLRYDERLRIAEDDDLIVRALLAGLRYWLEPTSGYFYRKHDASTSHRLSIANAQAMFDVSGELIEAQGRCPQLPLLVKRHRALRRALSFLRLVDALKAKRASEAIGIAVRQPSSLALLRMPIRAAFERIASRSSKRPVADPPADRSATPALPGSER